MSTASFGFATQLPVEPQDDLDLWIAESICGMLVILYPYIYLFSVSFPVEHGNGQESIHWPERNVYSSCSLGLQVSIRRLWNRDVLLIV